MTRYWTPSELERREVVEGGGSVLANIRADAALVAWAKTAGRYVYIGRPSRWGNPYEIGRDGDRDAVCEKHAANLRRHPFTLADLESLRGKVLGCFCAPLRCHGDALLRLLPGRAAFPYPSPSPEADRPVEVP